MSCQNYKMPFGKYKGKDLLFITENNPKYLIWLDNECELNGNLKSAVSQMVKTSYFKGALDEYLEAEEQYLEACIADKDWIWK